MKRLLFCLVLLLASGCSTLLEPESPEARLDRAIRDQERQMRQQELRLGELEHRQRMQEWERNSADLHRSLRWRPPTYLD